MDFCDKLYQLFIESLFSISDERNKKSRALRKQGIELWASATDADLINLARKESKRPYNIKSYSQLLAHYRKTRKMHRQRLIDKNKRRW
ncbi:MAG: hypothetical protein Q8P20_06550 [bacterium]|nr:hypothetical protein [bacterium]